MGGRCLANEVHLGETSLTLLAGNRVNAGTGLPQVPAHVSTPNEGFGSHRCSYSAPQDQSRSAAPGRFKALPFAVLLGARSSSPSSHPSLCLQDPPSKLLTLRGRREGRGNHAENHCRQRRALGGFKFNAFFKRKGCTKY